MQDRDRMRPFCVRPGSFCGASKAQREVFSRSAEGVVFEPTRTRQRPNGFQEHPWFVARHSCYLRCCRSAQARYAR